MKNVTNDSISVAMRIPDFTSEYEISCKISIFTISGYLELLRIFLYSVVTRQKCCQYDLSNNL